MRKVTAEIAIHFPGLEKIDEPVVWVFPDLIVCVDSGIAEFAVPEGELPRLAVGTPRHDDLEFSFCSLSRY
ncbi:MAG TPA: hypothetical protein VNZ03_07940 [Terriglobales bacterium]|jgi:hypothetical protein|nr:hypothetical protein [Terriglobales bacterium]